MILNLLVRERLEVSFGYAGLGKSWPKKFFKFGQKKTFEIGLLPLAIL